MRITWPGAAVCMATWRYEFQGLRVEVISAFPSSIHGEKNGDLLDGFIPQPFPRGAGIGHGFRLQGFPAGMRIIDHRSRFALLVLVFVFSEEGNQDYNSIFSGNELQPVYCILQSRPKQQAGSQYQE